jgi:hypothetical protein
VAAAVPLAAPGRGSSASSRGTAVHPRAAQRTTPRL